MMKLLSRLIAIVFPAQPAISPSASVPKIAVLYGKICPGFLGYCRSAAIPISPPTYLQQIGDTFSRYLATNAFSGVILTIVALFVLIPNQRQSTSGTRWRMALRLRICITHIILTMLSEHSCCEMMASTPGKPDIIQPHHTVV